MKNLKIIEKGLVYIAKDEVICNSLQVAEKFGKRHDNVLRAIESLLTLVRTEVNTKIKVIYQLLRTKFYFLA